MSKSQYRSFFLPADDLGEASDALNAFLRQQTVQTVDRQFVAAPVPGWAFCVVYANAAVSAQAVGNPSRDGTLICTRAH